MRYTEIAEEVGRTRSSVSYAVGVLIRAGKISVSDGKITVRK
ncbi:MAG: winged helix-turn-helix transcriptional regulator [Lachnospiraceae bacterium]